MIRPLNEILLYSLFLNKFQLEHIKSMLNQAPDKYYFITNTSNKNITFCTIFNSTNKNKTYIYTLYFNPRKVS